RLLDTHQEPLIGPPDSSGKPILRPLLFQNMIVGYLSLTPLPWPEDELVQAFSQQQQSTLFVIALLALLLALTVAIPFGHRLVKPIRELAQGAAQLTRGHFDIRLNQHYSDEMGQLTTDFNTLARTLEKDKALRRHAMADISHELRTPLAVLRAEIEAMQDGIRNNDEKQLQILHDNVSGLSHLVDDLHELALSDVGALSYHKQEIDLANVIHATVQSMNAEFAGKNIVLIHDIEPNILLNADARRMGQVMTNILKNSLRYTNTGGRTEVFAQSNNNQATI
ncbi:MAG: HAMP domain-containing protein, partial [Planctomycetes bacterium]|nr:HAMP domain-containing protein [Planctomycetota bacterium]